MISTILQLRGVPTNRFSFFKGEWASEGEIRTQIWKIKPGAKPPVADSVPWNEPEPNLSLPFLYGNADEYGICPAFVPKAFAKLILDNPGALGHVVVIPGALGHVVVIPGAAASVNKFYFAEQWIHELVKEHGVPRKRLRLFFTKPRGGLTAAEFWFIPARKK